MKRQIEHNMQVALVQWLQYTYPDKPWFAVPNAGARSARAGLYYKMEGLRKGMLDVVFPIARKGYHGLVLELKSDKGKLTKEQHWFIEAFEREGWLTFVPRSIDQCLEAVKEYMG